nr:unnamed protein product [Spirometra erinaceieuropaei]
MVRQLHNGMTARFTDNGVVSEVFAATNGVSQGCVFRPTIFGLTLSATLIDACRDERPGIRVACRTDGHLFSQRLMRFQLLVSATTVHELLLVNDCIVHAANEGDMQRSIYLLFAACKNFGLISNTEKTVVMH